MATGDTAYPGKIRMAMAYLCRAKPPTAMPPILDLRNLNMPTVLHMEMAPTECSSKAWLLMVIHLMEHYHKVITLPAAMILPECRNIIILLMAPNLME
jgi:hypothetical protein